MKIWSKQRDQPITTKIHPRWEHSPEILILYTSVPTESRNLSKTPYIEQYYGHQSPEAAVLLSHYHYI